jgi:hypothetical protein
MTEQLGRRVAYVQGRSAHGSISRDFRQNRPEDVSGALAFAAGTHSERRFASVFVTASDGLTLHMRSYGSRLTSALPVVCLPGLARTAADFHPLAAALAADPAKPRLVLAFDYRGHGQSEYDRNPDNYTLPVALADLSAVLTALEIAPAIFIGQQHARKIKTSTPLSRWAGPN